MLHVEDWAEIRRLHFAEKVPIKQNARRLGVSKNTVKAKLAADAPPKYERVTAGFGRRRVRAADPGVAERLPDDAGNGDRGTGRVDPGDDGADRPGAGAAAGVSAAGSIVADRLRGWGDRAERLLVPRHRPPDRSRRGPGTTLVDVCRDVVEATLPTPTMPSSTASLASGKPPGPDCSVKSATTATASATPAR